MLIAAGVSGKAASVSELATASEVVVRKPTPRTIAPLTHVLLADSDSSSRLRREAQLRAAGFRVSVARTGFEAIVKASCQVPDIILVDGGLADIEAEETCRLLTTCPVTAHIPVVQLAAGRAVPRSTLSRLRRTVAPPS